MVALAVAPPGGAVVLNRRAWTHDDLAGAAIGHRRAERRPRRIALRGGGARGRRSRQRHRQAGVLRFLVRLDRQPLAAGDRHLHRRRRAGVRAGDPRQARGADPARLRALGRRRAPLARRGHVVGPAVRRPAAVLAAVHRHRADAIPTASRHKPTTIVFSPKHSDEGAKPGLGSVTLVGAGPGDPELLTLRAVRALQSADVILIDDLVAPAILDFARREAKKMMVGKTGFAPSCKQDEINALMVSLAKAGRRVVRLKGGDPMIFGRAGEEIAACRDAGIPVEVVPGISAAQGAASRLGVSLTPPQARAAHSIRDRARRRREASVRHRLGQRRRSRHHHRGLYAEARAGGAGRNGAGTRAACRYAGDRRRRGDAAGAGGHRRNDRGYRRAARSKRRRRFRCWS